MSSLTHTATKTAHDEDLLVAMLRAGIPISLVLDLATPDPHSHDLFDHEWADLGWAS